MKIGVIGTGVISSAVVRGIAGDGHEITVSERSATRSAELARAFDMVRVARNEAVVESSDVILLGLMAEQAEAILRPLPFRKSQHVISFMAGALLADVADWVAPAKLDALVLPFPGVAHGGSPLLSCGEQALVEAIFGRNNTVYAVPNEAAMADWLCAQAVLSPAARLVETAADWLEEKTGARAPGEAFLRHLVGSSLMGSDCASLIEALNTEGGYNQRLRLMMEQAGMQDDLRAALERLKS